MPTFADIFPITCFARWPLTTPNQLNTINDHSSTQSWTYPSLFLPKDPRRKWQIGYDGTTQELVTAYGIEDSTKIQSSRVLIKPKAGRDILQQSLLEINSAVKLKQDKQGYRFAGEIASTPAPAALAEPETEERPFPMLAHEWKKTMMSETKTSKARLATAFPAHVQPKIDGIRCLVEFFPGAFLHERGAIRLSSRSRNGFDHLLPIFERDLRELFEWLPLSTVIDGELVTVNPDGTTDFQKTTSAARSYKSLTQDARENTEFHVFTIFVQEQPELTFVERERLLEAAFHHARLGEPPRVKMVVSVVARSLRELEQLQEAYVRNGYEGAMVYRSNGIYEPNKRSLNVLKLKNFEEMEGTVIGVVPGKNGKEVEMALVILRVEIGGSVKELTMRPEGSVEERKKWLKRPELIMGKEMTFTYQNLTDDGIPRFPIAREFRDYE